LFFRFVCFVVEFFIGVVEDDGEELGEYTFPYFPICVHLKQEHFLLPDIPPSVQLGIIFGEGDDDCDIDCSIDGNVALSTMDQDDDNNGDDDDADDCGNSGRSGRYTTAISPPLFKDNNDIGRWRMVEKPA